jgi:hypothetical protein
MMQKNRMDEFWPKHIVPKELGRKRSYSIMHDMVRQAKPGGSSQLKGTDHGNCSLAM